MVGVDVLLEQLVSIVGSLNISTLPTAYGCLYTKNSTNKYDGTKIGGMGKDGYSGPGTVKSNSDIRCVDAGSIL